MFKGREGDFLNDWEDFDAVGYLWLLSMAIFETSV